MLMLGQFKEIHRVADTTHKHIRSLRPSASLIDWGRAGFYGLSFHSFDVSRIPLASVFKVKIVIKGLL